MSRVEVALGGDRSYEVIIESGLLSRAADHLATYVRNGRLVVVSDENVWAAQGRRLAAGLEEIELCPILIPPGEASKRWTVLADLVERLIALGVGRSDHILAFGGGVVGDVAGFAAAILKRGCGRIQLPTSLLAQVDSSVGGKTGINTPQGKNMVGAFHQAALVLIDPDVLDTLPPRELRAGYAEAVKYGLIGDPDFFVWCEANGAALLAGDSAGRSHAIASCVASKAAIVAADERDTKGRRALLNLGHTFGHALEAEAGFSGCLLHGEAVAIGMALAFRFSERRGLCPSEDADRVVQHLRSVRLPTLFDIEPATFVEQMRRDKKGEGGRSAFILAHGIGRAFLDPDVSLDEISAFLTDLRGSAV